MRIVMINRARVRIVWTALAVAFVFASAVAVCAARETGSQELPKVKIPKTATEHRAMAENYRLKAIANEQDAQTHRLMCEEYKFEVSVPQDSKTVRPSLAQAQKRCERYVVYTTGLAQNARELARYHVEQARALDGQ